MSQTTSYVKKMSKLKEKSRVAPEPRDFKRRPEAKLRSRSRSEHRKLKFSHD